jgi:acetyl esterase/lipase
MKTTIKIPQKIMLICMVLFALQKVNAQSVDRQEVIPLWNGRIANGPGPYEKEKITDHGSITRISQPRLIVHLPAHPIGTAMLVISGGGYAHLDKGKESGPAAAWLSSKGVVAFELIYRLPGEGWATPDVPFKDGQRAMRVIRSLAHRFGFSENKVGIMGFSAGGHLAAITETEPNKQRYAPTDEIDQLDARPDFAVLLYPVITMLPPYNTTHSEKEILGNHPGPEQEKAYSAELHVHEKTPPTFLAQALDDPISPVENSKLIYAALLQHHVLSELHLFQTGGHGWGMGAKGSPVHEWPKLLEAWAKANGFW